MTEQILIIVSKSEPDDACDRLNAFSGLNAISGEAGTDYVWYPGTKKFGIERKEITNLLGSLKDRQLVEQTQRGIKDYDRYFILIEGDYKEGPDGMLWFHSPRYPDADKDGWVKSHWLYEAVEGMLVGLVILGASIIRCKRYDYAKKIAGIVAQTSSTSNGAFIRERMRPVLPAVTALASDGYSDAIWALCAIDGCGPEIASALIEEYGTLANVIRNLAEASPPGIKSPQTVLVNGKKLGAKRAQRMIDVVNKNFGKGQYVG